MNVDPKEIELFSRYADQWWDKKGLFSAIHKMNPARLRFIHETATKHFDMRHEDVECLKGLSIIDIGCGGGVLSEPLARMGADVIGVDPCEKAIAVAKHHAMEQGLNIDYQNKTASDLQKDGIKADIVVSLEILEHVRDKQALVKEAASLIKPNGLYFASTLNRTAKSWALAIVASEYILRWVPQGTHHWKDFIKPHEMIDFCQKSGLRPMEINGIIYNPARSEFFLSKTDYSINYILSAVKSAP